MPPKTFFISTAIPYVNAKPHLGHALEFVQADCIARTRRLLGEEVYFLSGTDDNASKNVQAAEAADMPVRAYVDQQAKNFEALIEKLSISTDSFIKTSSDARHRPGVEKLWKACEKDIYKKSYTGLYCTGCEEFKTEKDLINNECPLHPGKKLEAVEEENYFFRLSAYQDRLLSLLENGDVLALIPGTRKNEMISFIKGGLEDFSISRSTIRAKGWGITTPGDDTQTVYVWFDALSNYINALGYAEESELYRKFWVEGETAHFVGKDINRFHTIYWPAMLLSAGIPVPHKVLVHGFITSGGQKMSKSIGNVIDPIEIIDEYGSEATRYILARELSTFEDSDLTKEGIKEAYNAHLANGLGNLASRILKMSSTYLSESVAVSGGKLTFLLEEYAKTFDSKKTLDKVWEVIQEIDKEIQEKEPFKVYKVDPEAAKAMVHSLVEKLGEVAYVLTPFLPQTAATLLLLIQNNTAPESPLFPRRD